MIRFLLNRDVVETDAPPGLLALDWLRRQQRLCGTKEGCKEGDCGACGVLVGELLGDPAAGRMRYLPMTSCLLPLAQLEGRHLVTIEGIDLGGGRLNPVQAAIVEQGASQCGFCTPGIVLSLTALLMKEGHGSPALPEREVALGLSGHLCRCTGYRSLKEAGALALGAIKKRGVAALVEAGALPAYFAEIPARLATLAGTSAGEAEVPGEVFVAGGTDLYVQQGEDLPARKVAPVSRPASETLVRRQGDRLHIAAAATFQELAENAELVAALPGLPEWMDEIASWQIRNRATLGGNIVNASPIGDLSILFLALRADLLLEKAGVARSLPLREFYLGYKKIALEAGELLREVTIEVPEGRVVGWEKVAKRPSLDIASVNLTFTFRQDGEQRLRDVGIAVGGVAPVPLALVRCEALLEGQKLDFDLCRRLFALAQEEIAPISDVRGSADYKRLLVRQLLIAQLTRHFPADLAVEDFYRQEAHHG